MRPAAPPSARRRAFTLVESIIALGVLTASVAVAAELVAWAIGERVRTDNRADAAEAAANVLEDARGRGWDAVTPEWAAAQKLPDSLAARLPDGRLAAAVEPEAGRPRVKRVTVTVEFGVGNRGPQPPVTLAALFAARTAGEKP